MTATQAGFWDRPKCTTCRRETHDLLSGRCAICRGGIKGRPTSPEGPALNDHFIAHYARLFLAQHPQYPEAFETRNLRTAFDREREWREFHVRHPEVWRAFRYVALQALGAVKGGKITARMVWEVIRLRLRATTAIDLGSGLDKAMADRSHDVAAWSVSERVPDSERERGRTQAAQEIEDAYGR